MLRCQNVRKMCNLKKWRQNQGVYIKGRIYVKLVETISPLAFPLIKMNSCAESAHLTASSIAPSQKEQWGLHSRFQIAFLQLHQSFPLRWSAAHKTHRRTQTLTYATQISNYYTRIPVFRPKSMIGEIKDRSSALYSCQAALVMPSSDITHTEPNLHQPTMRTRFGIHLWNPTHAKTFDPPNIVSSCAGPLQLCKHATVFTERLYTPWI